MRKFSNTYMLLYALGIAAVAAIVLSVAATSLKSRQEANKRNEQMQMLLATIGIPCERTDVAEQYSRYFKQTLVIPDNEGNQLTLYVYEKEGRNGFVIPTKGNGLWGPIYANVALAEDLNTVVGITFSHEGETPGLGAEITSDEFCNRFIGKKILDDNGHVVSIAVVKHADSDNAHQVDAISGGTMTSNGVSAMLADGLARYQTFIDSCTQRQTHTSEGKENHNEQ